MALKIISEDEDKQEEYIIDYPCLMKSIDPDPRYNEHICIILALSEYSGIPLVNTFDESLVGRIDDDWISFEDEEYWKPYNKAVTFCNK